MREAAQVLQQLRITHQLLGLLLHRGAGHVGAELVDRLRREAQVTHDRDAGGEDALDAFGDDRAALHLDGMRAGFLHDAHRALQRELAVALVAAERHVHHHQRPRYRAHHRRGMVDHLVQGDGQRRFMSMHDIGGAVAHQQHIQSGLIQDACEAEIVGGQHRDLLALRLHLREARRRDRPVGAVFALASLSP